VNMMCISHDKWSRLYEVNMMLLQNCLMEAGRNVLICTGKLSGVTENMQ
jgi:hypothetical protein